MARASEPEVIHLDTHVVCWLYEGRSDLLSDAAKDAVERGRLVVSSIVDLELQVLYEIGRISKGPAVVLVALRRDIGLEVAASALPNVVDAARGLAWTRDPFDRLIVAETMLAGAKLLTRDRLIRRHCAAALW